MGPITHDAAFFEHLRCLYRLISSADKPAVLELFAEDMATQHGVLMHEVMKTMLPIDMNENFLDPFHAITTPAGNVILLNLAQIFHHRKSFQTFVNCIKNIRPERGGRIWIRVRFNAGGRLRMRNDAGEALIFSSTHPDDVIGEDYTSWNHDKLLQYCLANKVSGITTSSTDAEMKKLLNDIKAEEQGWWSGDRLLWLKILRLWHWIVQFLTYLQPEFHLFQQGIRHFEPAVRTLCDVIVLCFGPRAVKTQLLVLRDVMPVLAFEALRHGDTLAIFDMRGTEDSHREHKKRANTKILRSIDGDKANVRVKVKKKEADKVHNEPGLVTEAEVCCKGSNTPKSTNAYHRKMLVECYHTLQIREKTSHRNMWARYQKRRSAPERKKNADRCDAGAPSPVAVMDPTDLEAWKALAADQGLFDRKLNGFGCQDLNISRICTFTETGGVAEASRDAIFTNQVGWAAKLKAYGWREKGGTLVLTMENKAMLSARKDRARVQYSSDFCTIKRMSTGDVHIHGSKTYQDLHLWLEAAPVEGGIQYSTKKKGKHGVKTIPAGSVRATLTGSPANVGKPVVAHVLGKPVQKTWSDGTLYAGTVASIDTCDGKNGQDKGATLYHILFDDGDEEDWYDEELMRNLVENQDAVRQAREAEGAMTRLTITLWQGNRAKELLGQKTKRLIENISSYSEQTRARRDGGTPAETPTSVSTIYEWDETTHANSICTAIKWMDAFFAREQHGCMATRYRMICECRDVCSINGFGIRVNSQGQMHYRCKATNLPDASKYLQTMTPPMEASSSQPGDGVIGPD